MDSSDSEDDPEPPYHSDTGKYCQCGAYRWIKRDCTHCNRVYETLNQADVSDNSVKEDPEDIGLDWSVGDFFDSLDGDEIDETGAGGVADTEIESKVENHKEEDTDFSLNFQSSC